MPVKKLSIVKLKVKGVVKNYYHDKRLKEYRSIDGSAPWVIRAETLDAAKVAIALWEKTHGDNFKHVLWGVRNGNEDWQEEILSTNPARFEEIKVLAQRDGWGRFRTAVIDLSVKPDFVATINGVKK